jgi:hypothetical protein
MAMIVQGQPLGAFAGNIQAQHPIPGPGPDAYKMIPGTDQQTYLVSPGVYDCAILAVVLPGVVINGPPGEPKIGGHRGTGARGMAHFNKFNGPKLEGIKALIDSVLRPRAAADHKLEVTIAHHTGARGAYYNALAGLVGQAAPGLATITLRSYGVVFEGQKGLNPITVYLAPDGTVSASQ